MNRSHYHSPFARHTFLTTWLLILFFGSSSQSSCPPLDSGVTGWPQDTTVYYDVSAIPSGLQSQVIAAFNAWNTANGQNNTGVSFQPADAQNPATYTVQTGGSGSPASTAISHPSQGNTTVSGATTTIDVNNVNGNWYDSGAAGYSNVFLKVMLHEIGHTLGLNDAAIPNMQAQCGGQTAGESTMNGKCGVNDQGNNLPTTVKPCDQATLAINNQYYRAPCPGNECNEGGQGFAVDTCSYPGAGGCPPGYHSAAGCCQPDSPTPVLIDIDGSGFHLTSADEGVWYDFYGNGVPIKISWTAPWSTNGWLVLDGNGNGTVDNAREMFGNLTSQPTSNARNGFLALAEFDKRGAGGNEDGQIDPQDTMFASLQIWIDSNHNGSSELSELFGLDQLGLKSLGLDYKLTKKVDQFGNAFRYRARVKDKQGSQLGRWAWDVFLVEAH